MAKQNPFSVLGFNQAVFKGLSDDQIHDLVKSQHRALSAIHHPDKGGDAGAFKAIQEAVENLQEDYEFDFWRRMFLRNRKDQIAEAQKASLASAKEAKDFQEVLAEFWMAFIRGRFLFHLDKSYGREGRASEHLLGFSVFNPPSVRILMLDKLRYFVRKLSDQTDHSDTLESDSAFQLLVTEQGKMLLQRLVKTSFDPRNDPMPNVHKELIELRVAPASKSYYWKPEGEPLAEDGVLLGSIPYEAVYDEQTRKKYPKLFGYIEQDYTYRKFDLKQAEHTYSLSEFRQYLCLFEPMVRVGRLMVFAEAETDFRLKIVGYVRKIVPF